MTQLKRFGKYIAVNLIAGLNYVHSYKWLFSLFYDLYSQGSVNLFFLAQYNTIFHGESLMQKFIQLHEIEIQSIYNLLNIK